MHSIRLAILATTLSAGLLAIGCGDSSSSPATPTPNPSPTPAGSATSVSIPQNASGLTLTAFNPNPITVSVGTTVRWTNTDSVAHTSTSNSAGWDSGTLPAGAHFDFTFQTAGTFPYHCAIHPGMVGTIVAH